MKKILSLIALALAVALPSRAQFVQSPSLLSIVTNSTVMVITNAYVIPANTTSNLTTPGHARLISVPRGTGFGLWLNVGVVGATNGIGVITVLTEGSQDGSNWQTAALTTASLATNASVVFLNYYTNWQNTLVDNIRYARVRSIQNANSAPIAITNGWFSFYK